MSSAGVTQKHWPQSVDPHYTDRSTDYPYRPPLQTTQQQMKILLTSCLKDQLCWWSFECHAIQMYHTWLFKIPQNNFWELFSAKWDANGKEKESSYLPWVAESGHKRWPKICCITLGSFKLVCICYSVEQILKSRMTPWTHRRMGWT